MNNSRGRDLTIALEDLDIRSSGGYGLIS